MRERYIGFQIGPPTVPFALVRAPLQLPHAVLDPAVDARTERAAEARQVDCDPEDKDVEEGECDGEGDDEGETEDVDVAARSQYVYVV